MTPDSIVTAPGGGDPISMTWPQYLRRECVYQGEIVKLARSACEALSVLLIRRGRYVPMADLHDAIYPDPWQEPEYADWSRDVLVSRLKHKLPGLIYAVKTRGFTIDTPRQTLAMAA